MPLTIYGASDDLIELEGDLNEEWNVNPDAKQGQELVVAVSDGTLIKVVYDGCWRIHRLAKGAAEWNKEESDGEEGSRPDGKPNYSDVVTLSGNIEWAALARLHQVEMKRHHRSSGET